MADRWSCVVSVYPFLFFLYCVVLYCNITGFSHWLTDFNWILNFFLIFSIQTWILKQLLPFSCYTRCTLAQLCDSPKCVFFLYLMVSETTISTTIQNETRFEFDRILWPLFQNWIFLPVQKLTPCSINHIIHSFASSLATSLAHATTIGRWCALLLLLLRLHPQKRCCRARGRWVAAQISHF